MNNLWNQRNLEPPPVSTCRVIDYKIDVKHLFETVNEATKFFEQQQHLEAEAALLSRCIYRMKMKFRNDKGFKAMQKMNSALLRCLQLDFFKVISTLQGVTPSCYEKVTYFPTKNLVDYVLVRLQGVGKLMCRTIESAQIAAFYMESKIYIGHFWKVVIIMLALISRIWALCKSIVKCCCKIYSELLPISKLLKNTSFEWLPKDYSFPDNLKVWLQVNWIDENEPLLVNPQFLEETAKIETEQLLLINDENKKPAMEKSFEENACTHFIERKVMKGFEMCEGDVGEIITRVSMIKSNKKKVRSRRKQIKKLKQPLTIDDSDEQPVDLTENEVKEIVTKRFGIDKLDMEEIVEDTTKQMKLDKKRSKRKRKVEEHISGVKAGSKKQKMCKSNVKPDTTEPAHVMVDKFTSLDDLKKFINSETKLRAVNPNQCVLNQVDKMQWKMLNKSLMKMIKKCENSKQKSSCLSMLVKAKKIIKCNIK